MFTAIAAFALAMVKFFGSGLAELTRVNVRY
jgi:hypothetical protein